MCERLTVIFPHKALPCAPPLQMRILPEKMHIILNLHAYALRENAGNKRGIGVRAWEFVNFLRRDVQNTVLGVSLWVRGHNSMQIIVTQQVGYGDASVEHVGQHAGAIAELVPPRACTWRVPHVYSLVAPVEFAASPTIVSGWLLCFLPYPHGSIHQLTRWSHHTVGQVWGSTWKFS